MVQIMRYVLTAGLQEVSLEVGGFFPRNGEKMGMNQAISLGWRMAPIDRKISQIGMTGSQAAKELLGREESIG